jgi:hypothetical protein
VEAASDGALLRAGRDGVPGSGRMEQRRPDLVDGAVEERSEELCGGDDAGTELDLWVGPE